MRNQFFGDKRDLIKWSYLLGMYDVPRPIFYIAMRRPDAPKIQKANFISPKVARFFELAKPTVERDLGLIEFLDSRITVFDRAYEPKDVVTYVNDAVAFMIQKGVPSPRIVFIDPDTGVADTSTATHIGKSELEIIWWHLNPGDTLTVYQHQQRIPDWQRVLGRRFASYLREDQEKIRIHHDPYASDVCFISLVKMPQS